MMAGVQNSSANHTVDEAVSVTATPAAYAKEKRRVSSCTGRKFSQQ